MRRPNLYRLRFLLVLAFLLPVGASLTAQESGTVQQVREPYQKAVDELSKAAEQMIENGELHGVSLALVDREGLIWADGFGMADEAAGEPATRSTVYRVGSISKLFNATMVMQLHEAGKLDIDQPLRVLETELDIVNPFGKPVTLRQLMSHRSGMFRESPVGGYYDPSGASLAETVGSVGGVVMVHEPETRTKYSNIGVALAGHIAASVAEQSFNQYQVENILKPLEMDSSSFLRDDRVKGKVANSYMRVAGGEGGWKEIESPVFELGTIPAGNLYSTAPDLANFARMLMHEGEFRGKRIIGEETLETMFDPQFTDGDTGFGLGFFVGKFRNRTMVSHNGAVYGFSSCFGVLPEEGLGVVALANDDIAIGPVKVLQDLAFNLLLQAREGGSLPVVEENEALSDAWKQRVLGKYESDNYWAEVRETENGGLLLDYSGQFFKLRHVGDLLFKGSGRNAHEAAFRFTVGENDRVNGMAGLGNTFTRPRTEGRPEMPEAWNRFLGSFGPDFIPLVISERDGRLYAMVENIFDLRLHPVNPYVFKFESGLYTGEELVFHVNEEGEVFGATLANMFLPRLTETE